MRCLVLELHEPNLKLDWNRDPSCISHANGAAHTCLGSKRAVTQRLVQLPVQMGRLTGVWGRKSPDDGPSC